MDSSLERRVKESSTKQVTQNKNHFPHDIFRKLAFNKEKENITQEIRRGYYMPVRGYEFYLGVVNSLSHEFADALSCRLVSPQPL